MKLSACRALLLAVVLLLPMAALPPANAQSTSYSLVITSVDASSFPDITTTLAVSDPKGLRVPALSKTAFTLLENNAPVAVSQITEDEVGVQMAVVLESSNVFSKRDASLTTRLDYVKTSLINFAVGPSDASSSTAYMKDVLDNVSIFAPEGPILQNSSVGGEIRNAVIAYQSEFRFETNLFGLISQAIDAVSGTPPRPGMRKEVVIFTSGIDATADAQTAAIAARANAQGITLHTILVGPAPAATLPLAKNVRALADLTGGTFLYFDQPDTINGLWDTLVSQRVQYRATYRSSLRQSGQHTLQALANVAGTSLLSSPTDFSVTIKPPSVTLLEIPAEINRASDERGADPNLIEPRSQTLKIKIDFPDGHPRAIKMIQLIVDQTIADEKRNAPFDTLTWDLTGYSDSGKHTIQAYVVDELDLNASSEATNVLVNVTIPPPITTEYAPVVSGALGIAVIAIAVGALVVAALVVLRRPNVVNNIVRDAGAKVKEVTEPFIPTPHRGAAKNKQGKAYLERIDETVPGPHPTIELIGDNLRLGRDETLAQIAINDKSVSRLHARITEEAEGLFFIHDEGSTSGTWVNYKQVSMTGQQLREGDVVNLGRVQLRFSLRYKDSGSVPPLPQTPAYAPNPSSAPAPWVATPADPVREDSTEAFEALPIAGPVHESTDQGIRPTHPAREAINDQYHTEAFSPPFEEPNKPRPEQK